LGQRSVEEDFLLRTVRLFLAAGSSAFFLSLVHLHLEFWFLSLFALVPYLWRLKGAGLIDSAALGLILAACLSSVVFVEDLRAAPEAFLFKLLVLSFILSLFGIIVNRIKKHLGYCPVFIAALWLPLEYCLIRYTGAGILLDLRAADSGWLARIASLFGLLGVSFFIVLVNSVSVLIIEYVGRKIFSTLNSRFRLGSVSFPVFESISSSKRWNCLPDLRAPPMIP
jgi:apolipoprotein N-acyltransferase